jgi:hypothetical protein
LDRLLLELPEPAALGLPHATGKAVPAFIELPITEGLPAKSAYACGKIKAGRWSGTARVIDAQPADGAQRLSHGQGYRLHIKVLESVDAIL